MQTIEFLHNVREFELERAISLFPILSEPCKVLEIGAGTGFQACILARRGYKVTAVEVSTSNYRKDRVYPVVDYDGKNLPLPDQSVNIVFSSNVLEHIYEIDAFLEEVKRVLIPGGFSIHILPTPSWRFWTSLCHYIWLPQRALMHLFRSDSTISRNSGEAIRPLNSWKKVFQMLTPTRHGERGNSITEIYYYSQHWWKKKFIDHKYEVITSQPVGLFYSGATIFGKKLSITSRQRLSRLLGSSCQIYVLRHDH